MLTDVIRECRKDWPGNLREDQYRVLNLIGHCRTGVLGERKWRCEGCGHAEVVPQSCGNRHCPVCLGPRQLEWSAKVCERLPAVEHFHVVFTIPGELKGTSLRNPREVLGILMRASAETLQVFMADKWKARGGFLSVLHTWGQQLQWHPHVHVLVSAGGLDLETGKWRRRRSDYLFAVRALSRVYRAIFLKHLRAMEEDLYWAGPLARQDLRDGLWQRLVSRDWCVYSAPTLGHTREVVRYLARYTSRVAISPHRICGHDREAGTVSLRYRDNRSGKEAKVLTLPRGEFVRRFAQHILPKGFQRIRYYGFLHPARYEGIKERLPTSDTREQNVAVEPVCQRCGASNWTVRPRCGSLAGSEGTEVTTNLGGRFDGSRSKPMGTSVSLLSGRAPPQRPTRGWRQPRHPQKSRSIVASEVPQL